MLYHFIGYEYTDVACSRLRVVIKWRIHDPFSSWKVVETHYFSFAFVPLMMLLAQLQGFVRTQG